MRILSVSSQVAYGPVGNSAAVPALQARGHEVLAIPTITLSNHPGHGKPSGFRTQPEDLGGIFAALENLGALSGVAAVLTGYFASPEQVGIVANILVRMKAANPSLFILIDPVLGDEAGLYVPLPVAEAIRSLLLPLASCITPNRFELAWLSGREVADTTGAATAARQLGAAEVLATSIPAANGQLTTLLITPSGQHAITTPRLAQVPHGTGDFLSGLYLAARVLEPAQTAFADAMAILTRAIAMSAGTAVLDVAGALHRP
jgi:pyridoxine kinase